MPERAVPDEFRVAFSLAGEQRDLVRPIVEEVERRLGTSTVFYDEWYEYYIAGSDADNKLQDIFLNRCQLAVACISGEFGSKSWTTAEHEAIRARYRLATGSPVDRDRVLLVRVGEGEVPGILHTAIVPDLRTRSVDDACQLIIDRLEHVTQSSTDAVEEDEWPDEPPHLRWPMADHSVARAAFAALLTRSSPSRVLTVAGPTNTGKSHMSLQMLANVESMPSVRCGRFDFKGTTGMELEFAAFVRALGLSQPSAPTLNDQFIHLFDALQRDLQPTVLVFDTYQDAGEGKDWVERFLLPTLTRSPWLRVVLLGQPGSLPSPHGTSWHSVAGSSITLSAPGPEDWLSYGREQRPGENVSLDFVTEVHEKTDGSPFVLARVLGPR